MLTYTHTPIQACYPIFSKDPNFRGLRIDRNYPQNWKNQPSSTMKTLFNGEVKEEEEEEEEDRGRGAAEEFPEGTYRAHPVYVSVCKYFRSAVRSSYCFIHFCLLVSTITSTSISLSLISCFNT